MYQWFYRGAFRHPAPGEWVLVRPGLVRKAKGTEGMYRIMIPAYGWDGLPCHTTTSEG